MSNIKKQIEELNRYLNLSKDECIKLIRNNDIVKDSIHISTSIPHKENLLELRLLCGDEISPCFSGEVCLTKKTGEIIDFSELVDDFKCFQIGEIEYIFDNNDSFIEKIS